MNWIDTLEKKMPWLGIENLTLYLLVGQILVFLILSVDLEKQSFFWLQGNALLAGEWWRVGSFLLQPFTMNPLFMAFAWYLYYMYGRVLENRWGEFKYTLYILLSLLFTVGVALLFPNLVIYNNWLFGSIFLAFAYLYPNFRLNLFFIIPVKIKWLAWLMVAGLVWQLVMGGLADRVLAVTSVGNFLLFFGDELWDWVRLQVKGTARETKKKVVSKKSYMKCQVCGATEADDKIFYVCDECDPERSFCEDHIEGHEHVRLN